MTSLRPLPEFESASQQLFGIKKSSSLLGRWIEGPVLLSHSYVGVLFHPLLWTFGHVDISSMWVDLIDHSTHLDKMYEFF